MTELNQEWKELRKQIGNFFCKLENEGNHAVANYEIRQKIYDKGKSEGYQVGYDEGRRDIWNCLVDLASMDWPERANALGARSVKEVVTAMSFGDFQLKMEQYREQKSKAEKDKNSLPVIGDVIKGKDISIFANESGIVIAVSEDKVKYVAKNFSRCEIGMDTYKNYFEKTGEHYDMTNSYFLKEDKK